MFAFNRTIMLMCSWLHQTCVCGDVDVVTDGSIIYLKLFAKKNVTELEKYLHRRLWFSYFPYVT